MRIIAMRKTIIREEQLRNQNERREQALKGLRNNEVRNEAENREKDNRQ